MAPTTTTIWTGPVLCFGELVWDLRPRSKRFLGGAPINVAVHLQRLGCAAVPVTAVGRDDLGREALMLLETWGLDTRAVAQVAELSTGTVKVAFRSGAPSFSYATEVAWEAIPVSSALQAVARRAIAVVHGSLALNSRANAGAIAQILDANPGLHVFDANLRGPDADPRDLLRAAHSADLVKVNRDELGALLGGEVAEDALEPAAAALGDRCNAARVCVTDGAAGAGLLDLGRWFWEPARPVEVRDTVGAGDAFLAGLLSGLLADEAPAAALARACRLAEFVAGQEGPTPDVREADLPDTTG